MIKAGKTTNMPALTVPENERNLLYLLSRDLLNAKQKDSARALARTDIAWERFAGIALDKMSLPFVYDHLRDLPEFEVIPQRVRDAMKNIRREFAFRSLRSSAAVLRFHDSCLQGFEAQYFFVKGPSLAQRFYEDPARRVFRDIDVVVEAEVYRAILERALATGYEAFAFADKSCPLKSASDIEAASKYLSSVMLIHPVDGILFELSRNLDKDLGLIPNAFSFGELDNFDLLGHRFPTLSTNALLCYICYHNSRHTWSRLHWVADLDAIVRHPSFDKNEARSLAGRIGMLPLLDACLAMNEILADPFSSEPVAGIPHGAKDLVALSYANLEGGLRLEKSLSDLHAAGGLPVGGLLDARTERRLRVASIRQRIKPDFVQYYNLPLPRYLQWFYYLSRPFRAIRRRLLGESDWIAPH